MERCLSSGAWRAADVWAAFTAAGCGGKLLSQAERLAADRLRNGPLATGGSANGHANHRSAGASDGRSGGGVDTCPLRHHIGLASTLAGASDRFACELLGAGGAAPMRTLEVLSSLHAGCAFHDDTRDSIVKLLVAFGRCRRFGELVTGTGTRGACARRLVLAVLHGVLKT